MSFGELALHSDKPRAATIQCKQDCAVAVLHKDDYNRIIKLNAKRALNQKIEFIENLECLKHLSQEKIGKIVNCFELAKFTRGAQVYKQGDPAEWVYLIRDGEFQITKTEEFLPERDTKQTFYDLKEMQVPKTPVLKQYPKEKLNLNSKEHKFDKFCRDMQLMYCKEKVNLSPKKNRMSLLIITTGKLFGFEDIYQGENTYS
jgi:CRP-like cAMP-binding protein